MTEIPLLFVLFKESISPPWSRGGSYTSHLTSCDKTQRNESKRCELTWLPDWHVIEAKRTHQGVTDVAYYPVSVAKRFETVKPRPKKRRAAA